MQDRYKSARQRARRRGDFSMAKRKEREGLTGTELPNFGTTMGTEQPNTVATDECVFGSEFGHILLRLTEELKKRFRAAGRAP